MAQPQGGFYFRLDQMSGRFLPVPPISPGDGTVCVTNARRLMRALRCRCRSMEITYDALTAAIAGGTRAPLVPWTF